MENIRKRISVCIAAYKPGDYLIEELESIIPQLTEEDEVVISDDTTECDARFHQVIMKKKWGGGSKNNQP